MLKFIYVMLTASLAVRSEAPVDAPEIRALSAAYGTAARGPCRLDADVLKPLASRLRFEVSFTLTEKHGECRYEFYATGIADGVRIPVEPLDRALADHEADFYDQIHSHPMANVAYFAEGHPYKYEVMFADEDMIRARQITPEMFERLTREVQNGRLPGFSFSPPSVQDFVGAQTRWSYVETGPKKIVSSVISSGGIWTYAINGKAQMLRMREALDNLGAFASQLEMAHAENLTAARRERARELYERNLASEDWGPVIREWRETGFELRTPYSRAALTAWFGRGDKSAILTEYARKVAYAKRFCDLLRNLGVDVTFEPFAEDAAPRT